MGLIDLPERDLVRQIIFSHRRLYDFFDFAISDALGPPPREGWDYLFIPEVSRRDLALPRLGKPGDIDLIIIPHKGRELHLHFAAAIEVKRLALRGPNWAKNVDTYGISQANGLLQAGFPYVGILHLVVHNEGPAAHRRPGQMAEVIDDNGRARLLDVCSIDMTGDFTADRQIGRLLAAKPAACIGLNCIALNESRHPDGRVMTGVTLPNGRAARRNPAASRALVSQLRELVRSLSGRTYGRAIDQLNANV